MDEIYEWKRPRTVNTKTAEEVSAETSNEPGYLLEVTLAPDVTEKEIHQFFKTALAEAHGKGFAHCRFSIDNINHPTKAIVEGWKEHPGNWGDIRWGKTDG